MKICRICATRHEVEVEVCTACGAVDVDISAADEPAARVARAEDQSESPTECEVPVLPDPGSKAVECYLGVDAADVAVVSDRLRSLDIPVEVVLGPSGGEPVRRVRVPMADLARALIVIDSLHKGRMART